MDLEDPETDLDQIPTADRRPGTALERIQLISLALSDAARRSRLSSRSRGAFGAGGFQGRRGARTLRWAAIISFCLLVVAPSVTAAVYYGFIASNQFVSEAAFTVSGGEIPKPDAVGSLTGIPAIAIIQDTQIVVNYIHSRAAVEALEQSVRIRDRYSPQNADWWARFDPKKPIEKFVKYWETMSDASIKMPAGIVELKIRAFSPDDARTITQATLAACETLINNMNDRMNRDAVVDAELEVQRTSQRLAAALAALEKARNETGLLDTTKSAEEINKLVTSTKAALLDLQEHYRTQLQYVLPSAPQMLVLKSRIDVTQAQVAEIESKLTSTQPSSADPQTVAVAMTKFGELDLEKQVAEHLYAAATASLEVARLNAEHKVMYLKTFVSPALPEEATYPRRTLYPALVLAGCTALWGLLLAFIFTVRNYVA